MVSAINSHVLNVVRHVESIKKLACQPQSPQHVTSSWKNSNQSNTSYLSLTFLVSFSMSSLPPTVSSTTSSHVLNVVKHVEGIKNNHINHHYHSLSYPSWKNSNWSDWYILMPATFLVFFSSLSLPSTLSSTTKPQEQKVGKWGIQEKDFQWRTKCSSHHLWVR